MNELIVAGYPSPHAALLAESTLSRLQAELSISCSDVAVLSRVTEDMTTIRESIRLNKKNGGDRGFWKRFARLLFPPLDDTVELSSIQAKLNSIGIDETAQKRIEEALPMGSTGVLVLTNDRSGERVAGMLSGFQGTLLRIRLLDEDPRLKLQETSSLKTTQTPFPAPNTG
ncbi:DUF1269 domain-containing protein [Pontiella sulfatireligans]|uniref:Uncharacterized protein n=1 Tax=Pontiella sulfatireligans TaxID=2750658 RepID=A0A6C2UTG1_9BACT|nr:DUF1269 domain-containing protein [Pontiella sulfatireligans]VGO23449.1 hypothetical protein SCARR_05556 [Pontiella sulfatireligans]